MKRALWLALPALLIVGAVGGYMMGQTEPYTYSYRQLAEAWPRLPSDLQRKIQVIMADGKMTEWEWRDIEAEAIRAAGFFRTDSEDRPDLESARNRLQKRVDSLPPQ
jgi:hypothetical protein